MFGRMGTGIAVRAIGYGRKAHGGVRREAGPLGYRGVGDIAWRLPIPEGPLALTAAGFGLPLVEDRLLSTLAVVWKWANKSAVPTFPDVVVEAPNRTATNLRCDC